MPGRANILTMVRHDGENAFHAFDKTFYQLEGEARELARRYFVDGYMECFINHIQEDEEGDHADRE